ncbi:MAG TPA: nucleotidyltransferase domain-containing protein [Atribacteraceae bacterium]|nr:nucleotidyltransferase domain-containing protein [Atribacteraceae bacterium]
MIRSRTELFNQIKCSVEEMFQTNLVALAVFGSYSRGDFSSSSDLDLFIVCRTVPSGRKRYENVEFDEDRLGIQVNPVIMSVEEARYFHPLYSGFPGGFVILLDPEGLLEKILLSIECLFRNGTVVEDEEMGVTYWRINDEQKVSQRLL